MNENMIDSQSTMHTIYLVIKRTSTIEIIQLISYSVHTIIHDKYIYLTINIIHYLTCRTAIFEMPFPYTHCSVFNGYIQFYTVEIYISITFATCRKKNIENNNK